MTRLMTFATLLFSLAMAPLALLSAPPGAGAPVLVVLPPWRDADDMLRRAGGRPVGPLRAPFAVMATGGTDLAARLRAAGAWAVTDAPLLARICATGQADA